MYPFFQAGRVDSSIPTAGKQMQICHCLNLNRNHGSRYTASRDAMSHQHTPVFESDYISGIEFRVESLPYEICPKPATKLTFRSDFSCRVGAVIWHAKSSRFLLYLRREGRDSFPARSRSTSPGESDLASLLLDPLAFVGRETGYNIERLPLRKYGRGCRFPTDAPNELFHPVPVALREVTTDPFKMTVETVWAPDGRSSWGQARQFVTFWFAGVIVDEHPPAMPPRKPELESATHICHLIDVDDAFKEFLDQGIDGDVDCEVLKAFLDLWNDTYPEQAV